MLDCHQRLYKILYQSPNQFTMFRFPTSKMEYLNLLSFVILGMVTLVLLAQTTFLKSMLERKAEREE